MAFESAVDFVVVAAIAIGAPVLVALFYAEGIAVGKIVQPPIVFIVYVAVVRPSRTVLVVTSLLCILAVVVGQWTLYRGFNESAPEFIGLRRRLPYLDEIPERVTDRVGEKRLAFVTKLFDRYGALAVVAANALPGLRGLMAIPAGLGKYPVGRFLAATAVGNLIHFVLLVAVAYGLLEAFGIVAPR